MYAHPLAESTGRPGGAGRGTGMNFSGHLWTLGPWLWRFLRPTRLPRPGAWECVLEDPDSSRVRLTGLLHEADSPRGLLIVVHGLGGTAESWYVPAAAGAALQSGYSCLRLNLRGADRLGEDIYHAGLTADVEGAVGSAAFERYERIVLLGYSMGGHVVLRYVTRRPDPRVAAVAAVSAPVDMERSAFAFDTRVNRIYRDHVLRGLREMFAATAARRPMPITVGEAARINSIREWDDRIVAPRFGFRDALEYYRTQSVAGALDSIAVPALLVFAATDPMIPADTVRPALARASQRLTVRWLDSGGHVGFPPGTSLGVDAPPGVERQVAAWLDQTAAARSAAR